mmetsp:Transcript_4005/g.6226  ORF Transcript_4005/g.6226 Transcript_4005/m.6226 type:complete len:137 (-) Transcript_4005:110-520(-)|eukprot:CAMPEP_0185027962 /NCGR_PEP_ID=MMETSP1103-20130426/13347_1 /TAXON_ID=36769 /ORGANISM="Paraphysomonas bandaiensis, Strain Caron Lab Isolate" /LENGTH=136 /DNA_ID=CAMNT_0027562179 /DNA_START=108 /DNA_END=518 /DNA_ORIENTATION=-
MSAESFSVSQLSECLGSSDLAEDKEHTTQKTLSAVQLLREARRLEKERTPVIEEDYIPLLKTKRGREEITTDPLLLEIGDSKVVPPDSWYSNSSKTKLSQNIPNSKKKKIEKASNYSDRLKSRVDSKKAKKRNRKK